LSPHTNSSPRRAIRSRNRCESIEDAAGQVTGHRCCDLRRLVLGTLTVQIQVPGVIDTVAGELHVGTSLDGEIAELSCGEECGGDDPDPVEAAVRVSSGCDDGGVEEVIADGVGEPS